ncbi:hypothetical protein FCL47_19200 [Desulfopila sp. IMCC35006]|uniref:sensor histidine kinase n=1 Tax=Desulfopila sp. IMCC35006 TaxID=2569542 RepID=UPI0010AC34EC|nr:ATP-binding protein [Desulfopila sp. IMCC35006]TKB24312.1 hypothetical protein FCL47_19200 [Desulfopila sp. IMCC35006]
MHSLTTIRTLIARKQPLAVMAACILLMVFIGVLTASNYRSQAALQDSALQQFRLDGEKRAASLGYFFSERKFDLRSMVASKEIQGYFQNVALGMSEQYGLKINLYVIGKLFTSNINSKLVQESTIYQRFLLIDENGDPLVDSTPAQQPPFIPRGLYPVSQPAEEPAVSIVAVGKTLQIVVRSPCIYKNRVVGELIAWIDPDMLFRNFIDNATDQDNKGFYLATNSGQVFPPLHNGKYPSPQGVPPEVIARIPSGEFSQLILPVDDSTREGVLLSRLPIHNMPICLLAWVRSTAYLSSPLSWHLLLGTGALAIIILLGIGLLIRFNSQNLILQQQYQDSEQQKLLLASRNQQLKDAIKKRHEAEIQLEKQQSMRIRSDRLRSLGEMAAGIAHELNQPLVGVRGLAELVLVKIDNNIGISQEELHRNIARIVEQSDRMVHIINHVRLFAREAGSVDTSLVNLNEVVQSAIGLLTAQFKSHGLILAAKCSAETLIVKVNPYSVEEVLLNLLNNARDALQSCVDHDADFVPTVEVSTGRRRDAGETIWVEVRDNGLGIAQDVQEHIFDPFFTTKDPDKGTGLGLSISKSIVEGFSGTIVCTSIPGEGSSFTVSFPAYQHLEETCSEPT